jgi:hypothetical protein
VKALGSTGMLRVKPRDLRVGEVGGIPGVVVKCVEIGRNTRSEGGRLDHT